MAFSVILPKVLPRGLPRVLLGVLSRVLPGVLSRISPGFFPEFCPRVFPGSLRSPSRASYFFTHQCQTGAFGISDPVM